MEYAAGQGEACVNSSNAAGNTRIFNEARVDWADAQSDTPTSICLE